MESRSLETVLMAVGRLIALNSVFDNKLEGLSLSCLGLTVISWCDVEKRNAGIETFNASTSCDLNPTLKTFETQLTLMDQLGGVQIVPCFDSR